MVAFVGGIGAVTGRGPAVRCEQLRRTATAESTSQDGNRTATWREELKVLLDRNTSVDTRAVLLFDLLKQSPDIAEELYGEAYQTAGLDGVAPVINQVVTDILPDISRDGPDLASRALRDLPTAIPKAVEEAKEFAQKNRDGLPDIVRREALNIVRKTPEGLETPDYKVLSKESGFEIREYAGITIAQTPLADPAIKTEVGVVEKRAQGFNTLAGYLFGGNETNESMSMTTPVIVEKTKDETSMSFVMPSKYTVENAPKPNSEDVSIRVLEGGVFACKEFPGFATEGEVKRQLEKLRSALEASKKVTFTDSNAYQVLQYNPPSTLPWLRRNEVLIAVKYEVEEETSESSES